MANPVPGHPLKENDRHDFNLRPETFRDKLQRAYALGRGAAITPDVEIETLRNRQHKHHHLLAREGCGHMGVRRVLRGVYLYASTEPLIADTHLPRDVRLEVLRAAVQSQRVLLQAFLWLPVEAREMLVDPENFPGINAEQWRMTMTGVTAAARVAQALLDLGVTVTYPEPEDDMFHAVDLLCQIEGDRFLVLQVKARGEARTCATLIRYRPSTIVNPTAHDRLVQETWDRTAPIRERFADRATPALIEVGMRMQPPGEVLCEATKDAMELLLAQARR